MVFTNGQKKFKQMSRMINDQGMQPHTVPLGDDVDLASLAYLTDTKTVLGRRFISDQETEK